MTEEKDFIGFMDAVMNGRKRPETALKPFYDRQGVVETCAHGIMIEDDCKDCEITYCFEEIARHKDIINHLEARLEEIK